MSSHKINWIIAKSEYNSLLEKKTTTDKSWRTKQSVTIIASVYLALVLKSFMRPKARTICDLLVYDLWLHRQIRRSYKYEPPHDKTNPPSLIRVMAVRSEETMDS